MSQNPATNINKPEVKLTPEEMVAIYISKYGVTKCPDRYDVPENKRQETYIEGINDLLVSSSSTDWTNFV